VLPLGHDLVEVGFAPLKLVRHCPVRSKSGLSLDFLVIAHFPRREAHHVSLPLEDRYLWSGCLPDLCAAPRRAGRYHFEHGKVVYHETSPHRVVIAGQVVGPRKRRAARTRLASEKTAGSIV
jgi:hypothetical protein